MARQKKQVKFKEPVRIRTKPLSNGNRSIFLDVYWQGVRKYEYLKLYPDDEDAQRESLFINTRVSQE